MEIKNAKAIQGKSRAHKVSQEGSRFSVVSGTSGSTYRVELLGIGGAQCSCDWGSYRPASILKNGDFARYVSGFSRGDPPK